VIGMYIFKSMLHLMLTFHADEVAGKVKFYMTYILYYCFTGQVTLMPPLRKHQSNFVATVLIAGDFFFRYITTSYYYDTDEYNTYDQQHVKLCTCSSILVLMPLK
jgi:hypothetical protein